MRNRFESVPNATAWAIWDDKVFKTLPEVYDSLKDANEMCKKLNESNKESPLQVHSDHENECHFMEEPAYFG